MNVFLPFTLLRQETYTAVQRSTMPGDRVLLAALHSDWDYASTLCGLWHDEPDEDLVVIEHDVVIHTAVLHGPGSFEECERPWCCYPYSHGPGTLHEGAKPISLGCMRFRAGRPPLLSDRDGLLPCRWDELDRTLVARLEASGEQCHLHEPEVLHLHERETVAQH